MGDRRREQQERERERERAAERERRTMAPPSAPQTNRQNEYFLPKDGIDREVITADICRYLGNNALVRPGAYTNPQTRQTQQGYFINAYRNLTSAMIQDLKADSARWEAERRAATGGRPSAYNAMPEYRTSMIHQSRQYHGPSDENPPVGYVNSGYAAASTGAQSGSIYDTSGAYPDAPYGQDQATAYGQQQDYPPQGTYVYGGAFERDTAQGRGGRPPVVSPPSSGIAPRDPYASSNTPTSYTQAPDPRYISGYSQPPGAASQYPTSQQPVDSTYGRAVPVTGPSYAQPDYGYDYHPDTGGYPDTPMTYATQSIVNPPTTTTAPAETSRRRERERDTDRPSGRHHRDRDDRTNRR